MTAAIDSYVQTCDTCQRVNKKLEKPAATLHPISVDRGRKDSEESKGQEEGENVKAVPFVITVWFDLCKYTLWFSGDHHFI